MWNKISIYILSIFNCIICNAFIKPDPDKKELREWIHKKCDDTHTLSGVSLWLILQSCPQKLKPCEKPCWVVKCNEKDQVNITMSNSLIGSGGTDNDKGYTHGYDEWPECVVCMCSCFKPLDISADRLLMLAFIWFLLSFTYCHGSSHPLTPYMHKWQFTGVPYKTQ